MPSRFPSALILVIAVSSTGTAAIAQAQTTAIPAELSAEELARAAATAAYARALQAYRSGNADAAVSAVVDVPMTLKGGPTVTDSPRGSPARLDRDGLAAAFFLTENGMTRGTFGRVAMSAPLVAVPPSDGLTGMFEARSLLVYRWMNAALTDARQQRATRATTDDVALIEPAIRDWYVVTVSYCARWGLHCTAPLTTAALRSFQNDDQILLLAGAVQAASGNRAAALRLLRQALAIDAGLVEARVRLARLLLQAGQRSAASRELVTALAGARSDIDAFSMHVALQLLAQLDDGEGKVTDARQHRVAAAAIKPFDDDAMFKGLDVWSVYDAGLFSQIRQRLVSMRAVIR